MVGAVRWLIQQEFQTGGVSSSATNVVGIGIFNIGVA